MSHGIPLDDDDRLPWLKAIAARIDAARQTHRPIIVTCSALKRSYREIFADGHDDVGFVYLQGAKELIAQRLAARTNHFMPPGLLDSQFRTLEPPLPSERPITVSIEPPVEAVIDDIIRQLDLIAP
jgi:gluconokinase